MKKNYKYITEVLRKSEQYYKELVNIQPDLISRQLPDGTITYVNDAVCDFFGVSRGDLLNQQLDQLNFIHAEDLDGVLDIATQLSHDKPIIINVNRNLDSEGKPYWFQWTNLGIFDEEKNLTEIQCIGRDITSLKELQDALSRSEERYRLIVQTQTEMIEQYEPGGKITFINDAFREVFGTRADELTARELEIGSLVYNGDADMVNEVLANLRPDNPIIINENRNVNAKGEVFWARWVNKGIFDQEGNLIEVQCVGRDISERKYLEDALRRSEELYRGVVQAQRDLIVNYDHELTIIYVNRAYADFFGGSTEELIGTSLRDLESVWGKDRDNVEKTFARITLECPIIETENRNIRQDGEVYWHHWINQGIFNEDGKLIGYQSVGRDITSNKKLENALRLSREHYRGVVDTQKDLIAHLTPDGAFTFVNKAYCKFFGGKPEDWIGEMIQWTYGVFEHDKSEVMDIFETITPENPIVENENRNVSVDGNTNWYHWVTQGIFTEEGELLEYQCAGRDITLLKQMETALAEAEKLAGLGTLAAGVAHEINSPLQVITGLVESIIRRAPDDMPASTIKDLEIVQRNAWRVVGIVQSLRTYANALPDQIQLHYLNELIQDTLLLTAHQLKSWSNIQIQTELEDLLPPLRCDRNQITQVLINLMINARDAMPQGGEITIKTGYDRDKKHHIVVVQDTGTGIPEEMVGRIFDPFFTTKPIGEGTGLGLSIVAGIIHGHHGTIDVRNLPGGGAAFTIHLKGMPHSPSNEVADSAEPRYDRYS